MRPSQNLSIFIIRQIALLDLKRIAVAIAVLIASSSATHAGNDALSGAIGGIVGGIIGGAIQQQQQLQQQQYYQQQQLQQQYYYQQQQLRQQQMQQQYDRQQQAIREQQLREYRAKKAATADKEKLRQQQETAASTPTRIPEIPGTIRVTLQKDDSGTFRVPVRINDSITIPFVVDSGASTVTIPDDVVKTLLRSGTVSKKDIVRKTTFTMANGAHEEGIEFRLASVQVGDYVVKSVLASTISTNGTPLLGQSFLSQFTSWTWDTKAGVLVLKSGDDNQPDKTTTADTGTGQGNLGSSTSYHCLLYTSPSPRDLSTSRMPSSA